MLKKLLLVLMGISGPHVLQTNEIKPPSRTTLASPCNCGKCLYCIAKKFYPATSESSKSASSPIPSKSPSPKTVVSSISESTSPVPVDTSSLRNTHTQNNTLSPIDECNCGACVECVAKSPSQQPPISFAAKKALQALQQANKDNPISPTDLNLATSHVNIITEPSTHLHKSPTGRSRSISLPISITNNTLLHAIQEDTNEEIMNKKPILQRTLHTRTHSASISFPSSHISLQNPETAATLLKGRRIRKNTQTPSPFKPTCPAQLAPEEPK